MGLGHPERNAQSGRQYGTGMEGGKAGMSVFASDGNRKLKPDISFARISSSMSVESYRV
jgi:hypothetical protein